MNPATWMADPQVQQRTVGTVVLPGTHDSGTFSLQKQLSQVEYPNISFLWTMQAGQAPAGFPDGNTAYVGPYAYAFVMDLVLATSTAQGNDFTTQLNDGIRFLDVRAYWDTSLNDVYIQHGLRGASLGDLFNGVAAYLHSNPDGRELILIQISHTNFGKFPAGAQRVVDLVNSTIGRGAVYSPASANAFASTVLTDITGDGSRCVLLNPDEDNYPDTSLFLSGSCFGSSGRGPDGTASVQTLISLEAAGLAQPRTTTPLYQVAWTLTPDLSTIAAEAVSRLENTEDVPLLRHLASTAAVALDEFIGANSKYTFNLLTVDWYQDTDVVATAARLSGAT